MTPPSPRYGILFNPISGAGTAKAAAALIKKELEAKGWGCIKKESRPSYDAGELAEFFNGLTALIVAGGDGTLMPLLEELAVRRVAFVMYPSGNESLFARATGMRRSIPLLLENLERGETQEHYYAYLNGRPFFCMASVGLDAEVIQELSVTRCGPVGTRGYVLPLLRALARYRAPELTVWQNGKLVIEKRRGYLNIANSPEYARSLRLVPEADSRNPILHARFYPHASRLFYYRWMPAAIFRKAVRNLESTLIFGDTFQIEATGDRVPIQADGEAAGHLPAKIETSAKTLLVLRSSTNPKG